MDSDGRGDSHVDAAGERDGIKLEPGDQPAVAERCRGHVTGGGTMSKTELPMLEQRRIEANILKPVYEELVARLGVEVAQEILGAAIIRDSISQGRAYGEGLDDTGLLALRDTLDQWKASGALEMDMLEETDEALHFNVVRCRYSEMYREMGLGEIGHLLSCNRDGTFCTGFDPRIKLERTQTIMAGASHCNFRYRWEEEPD